MPSVRRNGCPAAAFSPGTCCPAASGQELPSTLRLRLVRADGWDCRFRASGRV